MLFPSDITKEATGSNGAPVDFAVSAKDDVDGDLSSSVACDHNSGDTFGLGTTTVTCTATDKAGNKGTASFKVNMVYDFSGFLQPVNDTAHQTGLLESKFKLGQTIPLKFLLKDASGNVVQQSTNPTFSRSNNLGSCDSQTTLEDPTNLSSDSGSSYTWDGSQYHYNWNTKGLSAGEYRVYANLDDGTKQHVDICLTEVTQSKEEKQLITRAGLFIRDPALSITLFTGMPRRGLLGNWLSVEASGEGFDHLAVQIFCVDSHRPVIAAQRSGISPMM